MEPTFCIKYIVEKDREKVVHGIFYLEKTYDRILRVLKRICNLFETNYL